jgi:Asp-tRNA(Asn)/Glu-tRNA(Gln) amidotransferase A subunit family amidase
LRIPAAFCGITSIRPTAGRTPNYDLNGWPNGQRAIISQVGPMARHVDDLTLALQLLEGGRDPFLDPQPKFLDPSAVAIDRLRFATFVDDGEFRVAPAARRAVGEASRFLTDAGAKLVSCQMPPLHEVMDLFFACLSADCGRAFRRMLRGNKIDSRIRSLLTIAAMPTLLRHTVAFALDTIGQKRSAVLMKRFASGSAEEYWHVVEAMMSWRRDLLLAMDAAADGPIDCIPFPAYPLPALRHGATLSMPIPGVYAPLANVTGFPAGVVPVTRVRSEEESDRRPSRDRVESVARDTERGSVGLPICVQVLARPWHDHVVLATMAAIETKARKQPDYPIRPPLVV